MASWTHLVLGPCVTALAATAKSLKLEFLLFGGLSWPVGVLLFSETLFVYILDHLRDLRKVRKDTAAHHAGALAVAVVQPRDPNVAVSQALNNEQHSLTANGIQHGPHHKLPEHNHGQSPAADVPTSHHGEQHPHAPTERPLDKPHQHIFAEGDYQSQNHLVQDMSQHLHPPVPTPSTKAVKRMAYALLVLSVAGMVVSMVHLPWQASVILVATIVVGVLWSVPVLPGWSTDHVGARKLRLRKFKDIPLLKGPFLSAVLIVGLAGVPIASHIYGSAGADRDFHVMLPFRTVWTVVVMEYVFLLTNAVLYDMRDVVEDTRNRVPTWPVLLGVWPTCITLAGLNVAMGVIWMIVEMNWLALISALILAAFSATARPTRRTIFYIALEMVDFVILLLLVIYWAADEKRNPLSSV